jgi:ATPase subunit of ABC transporter with duplicated ATPase domains
MTQFVGARAEGRTVRDLLVSLSSPAIAAAGRELDDASRVAADHPGDSSGLRLAAGWAAWGEAGGYEAEIHWDACCTRALGLSLDAVSARPVSTLSGGEQKRLALEVLLRSAADVLLLDEPDNYLDVAAKRWLESQLVATPKTVLYVSHDRELLANTATKIVTIEGRAAWTHGGSFGTYREARADRLARLDDEHRRWAEERKRLHELMRTMKQRAAVNDANASRARAAETRLRHFDEAGPPAERAKDQNISMRLVGGRTGKRVVVCERLELAGLTEPFSAEIDFGERIGVIGPNGTGKSHFLRLLAGEPVAHDGEFRLGARVVPGYFSQTHDHPEFAGRSLLRILAARDLDRGSAMARLRRYELDRGAEQPFDTLSGGEQARMQILVLELEGATLLLLDEPTDNLDLASAEALEDAISTFEGTIIAVTHDRWFMRSFDRFLRFDDDCTVVETDESPAQAGAGGGVSSRRR